MSRRMCSLRIEAPQEWGCVDVFKIYCHVRNIHDFQFKTAERGVFRLSMTIATQEEGAEEVEKTFQFNSLSEAVDAFHYEVYNSVAPKPKIFTDDKYSSAESSESQIFVECFAFVQELEQAVATGEAATREFIAKHGQAFAAFADHAAAVSLVRPSFKETCIGWDRLNSLEKTLSKSALASVQTPSLEKIRTVPNDNDLILTLSDNILFAGILLLFEIDPLFLRGCDLEDYTNLIQFFVQVSADRRVTSALQERTYNPTANWEIDVEGDTKSKVEFSVTSCISDEKIDIKSDSVEGETKSKNFFTRFLKEMMPKVEYRRRQGETKTVLHWGQRKLLLSEIEFLTDYSKEGDIVLYAGAAPGSHIAFLSRLFPGLEFHLFDPGMFAIKEDRSIHLFNEYFTSETARRYRSDYSGKLLFISDVRTAETTEQAEDEIEQFVIADNIAQMDWYEILQPKRAMLKFRLPYPSRNVGGTKTWYLDGSVYLPIWGTQTTTETRLVPHGFTKKWWDHSSYEQQMFWFNTAYRISEWGHSLVVDDAGLDSRYDSCSEVHVLRKYVINAKSCSTEEEISAALKKLHVDLQDEFLDTLESRPKNMMQIHEERRNRSCPKAISSRSAQMNQIRRTLHHVSSAARVGQGSNEFQDKRIVSRQPIESLIDRLRFCAAYYISPNTSENGYYLGSIERVEHDSQRALINWEEYDSPSEWVGFDRIISLEDCLCLAPINGVPTRCIIVAVNNKRREVKVKVGAEESIVSIAKISSLKVPLALQNVVQPRKEQW